jgi:hypothetical protein
MMFYDYYAKKRLLSRDLQDPRIVLLLQTLGFNWVRRYNPPLNSVLRMPTVGCWVEVLKVEDVGCVYIESPEAKKLINRICYF